MRPSQPGGRYNQLAAVGQSNRGGERPTVYNQRNKKHHTGADEFRVTRSPCVISFTRRLPHRLLLTLEVTYGSTRHLPIVSQTGVAANHQNQVAARSDSTSYTIEKKIHSTSGGALGCDEPRRRIVGYNTQLMRLPYKGWMRI